jgi:hypothetical protein
MSNRPSRETKSEMMILNSTAKKVLYHSLIPRACGRDGRRQTRTKQERRPFLLGVVPVGRLLVGGDYDGIVSICLSIIFW